ncbi:MAG: hypothetical protein ACRDJS_03635 [Actinomycetota bacterium]
MYLRRDKGTVSSSSAMTLRGEVGRRPAAWPHRRGRASAPSVELYPGILESLRVALTNRRARQRLADANELAERGRATGVRV